MNNNVNEEGKIALIKIISFFIMIIVGLGIFSIAYSKGFFSEEIIHREPKTIDEYIIINVRLSQSIDGSTFFLFDYAKNGEPMTVYLPHAESVETFTNRLELLGSVIWLCDEPTTP